MNSYKTMKVPTLEVLNNVLISEEPQGWKPLFITPVNEIDSTGLAKDSNGRAKRYFYYLVTLEQSL